MAEAMTVAAAAAAAAGSGSDEMLSEDNFNVTQFLVNYLLTEADQAEQKAKKLREQAESLARRYNVSTALQEAFGKYLLGAGFGS